jgi:2,3-bisphosphoglycerate-dependent phosphoglycerate mutase
MPTLVLLRHGQSHYNQEGRFTGWRDIDLSPAGVEEARRAGRLLRCSGCTIDLAYTSVLKRAIRTLWIVLDEMDLMWLPVTASWRLNERCYGALQGQSKRQMEERYGPDQVHQWRRSFRDLPPEMDEEEMRSLRHDPRYAGLADDQIPKTESLQDTLQRLLPCWQDRIAPSLRAGKKVFIAAHGNTIRALVKHLDSISDAEIETVEMPTGIPLVYELGEDLVPFHHYYLRSESDCERLQEKRSFRIVK